MAISHLFPEEGPTLNLNFAGSRTLDPRITFTRTQTTSNGSTYMGRDGLVKYAGPDEPRFDHRYVNGEIESLGLLIEEQRINLVTYSEDFTNSIWDAPSTGRSRATIVTRTGVDDPSGGTTAATFKNGGTLSDELIWRFAVGTANVPYTMSVWIRRRSGTGQIDLVVGDNIAVEITNQVTNQWKRISLTATPTTTTVRAYILIKGLNDEIDVWGYQLEQGSFPTSYIPTEGSTKTRNQDRTLIDVERFTEWYNPTEGTFFCTVNDPKGTVVFGVGDTFENTIYTTAGGAFSAAIRSGNVGTSLVGEISRVGTSKVALAVKTDNSSLCINGAITGSSLTADMPLSTLRLTIGASSWSPTAGDNQVGGTISQLTYYPQRLTNSQLVALTR